jgi:hypothetical protein
MFPTHSPLFQADNNLFLNLAMLNLVRFEVTGKNMTAHLKFQDGESETVQGESARNLQRRLTELANTEESAPSPAERADRGEVSSGNATLLPVHIDITTAPLLGRNKAWFCGKDKNGRSLILAFVNAKGSSSVRPFDGETGIALGKRYAAGPYQECFADLLEGATELTVEAQPNLERDCKQRLPERLLAYLKKEIEKIA